MADGHFHVTVGHLGKELHYHTKTDLAKQKVQSISPQAIIVIHGVPISE